MKRQRWESFDSHAAAKKSKAEIEHQQDTNTFIAPSVTERYAHILDDNRRVNAERFQQQFYSSPVSEEPAKQSDPIQEA